MDKSIVFPFFDSRCRQMPFLMNGRMTRQTSTAINDLCRRHTLKKLAPEAFVFLYKFEHSSTLGQELELCNVIGRPVVIVFVVISFQLFFVTCFI